jgi:hypothetical protein
MTLGLAVAIWVTGCVTALIRGINTHDPLEIARRFAISALWAMAIALIITVSLPICVSVSQRMWQRARGPKA